ncbi:hypothetical protein PV327_010600 [Microctonus hyperodae]|uniref:Mediator of RNA polymerase II transcription subunit 9 n=1 Tax=Microctonus hyperodae TaxID=165561 RepID=A0AA39FSA1_MICHY|nr:hypothetical protein PV327_010600 [Microctonus hyperodae]
MEVVELPEETPVNRSSFTVNDLDIEILPLIYEIIRSVEKDPYDTTQKVKESQDTSQKILELQKKLDSARSQIKRLPGIEYSKEEQLEKLETLRKQLRLKRELLFKYRNMSHNEKLIAKMADSRPIRRAAQFVVYILTRGNPGNKLPGNREEFITQIKNIANKYANDMKKKLENTKK